MFGRHSGRGIPDAAQADAPRVTDFFDETRTWLVRILSDGLKDSTLNFRGAEHDVAQSILSTLEGAMLIAGPYTDVALFDSTVRLLLANLDR